MTFGPCRACATRPSVVGRDRALLQHPCGRVLVTASGSRDALAAWWREAHEPYGLAAPHRGPVDAGNASEGKRSHPDQSGRSVALYEEVSR